MSTAIPNLLLFEDHQVEYFHPLADSHAFFDLPSGKLTPLEKAIAYFPQSNVNLHCRPQLKDSVREKHPGILVNTINASLSCLMINARLVLTPALAETFQGAKANQVWIDDHGDIAAMLLNHAGISALQAHLSQSVLKPELAVSLLQPLATIKKIECRFIANYWEMLLSQTQTLKNDFENSLDGGNIQSRLHPGCELISPENIAVGPGSTLSAHTLLDASAGPIWIGAHVKIQPFTWIAGPALIASGSVLEKASIQNSLIGENNYIAGTVKDSWSLEHVFVGHLALVQKSILGAHSHIGEQAVLLAGTDFPQTGSLIGDHGRVLPQSVVPAATILGTGTFKPEKSRG